MYVRTDAFKEISQGTAALCSSTGLMLQTAIRMEMDLLLWLIGDSSWLTVPLYSEKEAIAYYFDSDPIYRALVCNLSVSGQALRQNKRHQEKKLDSVVATCGMPVNIPFVPIQVPFRRGCRDWSSSQGFTREEEFVAAHGVRFIQPLVEIVDRSQWTDKVHFSPDGTEAVLRHALAVGISVLKNSQGTKPIVCVLSDGWNRHFRGADDRSRYWRCRLDFSQCTTLADFKNWCHHYAWTLPKSTDSLPA